MKGFSGSYQAMDEWKIIYRRMSPTQRKSMLKRMFQSEARPFLRLNIASMFKFKNVFLVLNLFQVVIFAITAWNNPGDLSLIISLVVRLAIVSMLANIPPIYRRTNRSMSM